MELNQDLSWAVLGPMTSAVYGAVYGAVNGAVLDDPPHPALRKFLTNPRERVH